MQSLDALPNFPRQPGDGVTAPFLALDMRDFHAAAHYVYQLPYGRTADRAKFRQVLTEGCGTCSTKHALLAQLALEQGVAQYSLSALPEAHCYLPYNGVRIDITRAGVEPAEPIRHFLYEEPITPEQIGSYKVALHQRFLQAWLARAAVAGGYTVADLWRIREACIAALGQ